MKLLMVIEDSNNKLGERQAMDASRALKEKAVEWLSSDRSSVLVLTMLHGLKLKVYHDGQSTELPEIEVRYENEAED